MIRRSKLGVKKLRIFWVYFILYILLWDTVVAAAPLSLNLALTSAFLLVSSFSWHLCMS